MAKLVDSVTVGGDYRVSRTPEGLRIEVLDYHAGPLHLDRETLQRLGLRFVDERPGTGPGARPADPHP